MRSAPEGSEPAGPEEVAAEMRATFIRTATATLAEDARLVGVAAGGSFVAGGMDEFSDLDLVITVEPSAWPEILGDREAIAGSLGPLLAAFTGEHVGEPRVLICLYGPPLLHVDLKFISLHDVGDRVEDPTILWEREGTLSSALLASEAEYPTPDHAWIEDRFWIWIHYLAGKIGRGEFLEAINTLSFLRFRVLGPLALERAGARPEGVRRIETAAPEIAARFRATVAAPDTGSCLRALDAAVALYRDLRHENDTRGAAAGVARPSPVEREVMRYLRELPAGSGLDGPD